MQKPLPDFAKDIRLNLEAIEKVEGISDEERRVVVLTCAYTAGIDGLEEGASATEIEAAKAAASIMAMNNVYYRAMHWTGDEEIQKLPARLRMTVIGKPPVNKRAFELACLAASAINGCERCVRAHVEEAKKADVSREGIQNVIRIAAVINATATASRL